jgi:hypothetical protein
MHKHETNPQRKLHGKGNYFNQEIRVYAAFNRNPATMLMVSIETGILRANICRYVSKWKRNGSIRLFTKGICRISKHSAGYYTTSKPF